MNPVVLNIVKVMLALSLLLAIVRLVRGPSTPDRVVALDLVASIVVGTVGVLAIDSGVPTYLDVAIVMALTGFLATVGFSRYVERKIRS